LVVERLIRERLSSVEPSEWSLIGKDHRLLSAGKLDELLEFIVQALRRSSQVEEEFEEIGRMSRGFWKAVHGKASPGGMVPETSACVASLFELFRQTADTLVSFSGSLEEANERMASGALDQSDTVTRTTSTVEALSDKIDRISQNAENAAEACD